MKLLPSLPALAALFLAGSLSSLQAQSAEADPTGAWRWSFTGQGGQTFESTLTLRKEGDRFTGALRGRGDRENPVENVRLKGDDLSFQVTRERGGNRFVTKYQGKIKGDLIQGEIESQFGGETRTRPWEAKREPANIAGRWVYSLTVPSGQTFEPVVSLKQKGAELEGTVQVREFESPISKGKVQGNTFSFEVVRERDGNTFSSVYTGKLDGDVLRGTVKSNWGGNERTSDFVAKRQN